MKQNVMDMTRGPIMPQLVKFGTPVLLGMMFQRIYNFVDVFIVGRYLGDEALAAVSIAGSAMYLLMSLMKLRAWSMRNSRQVKSGLTASFRSVCFPPQLAV